MRMPLGLASHREGDLRLVLFPFISFFSVLVWHLTFVCELGRYVPCMTFHFHLLSYT